MNFIVSLWLLFYIQGKYNYKSWVVSKADIFESRYSKTNTAVEKHPRIKPLPEWE